MIYLELFLGFLRVGLFAFGGGYGAIPLIREVVLSYGWLDDDMLSNMIAISESTPGPIMVNLATYIGSSQAGILGAVIATATVVLPAFVIILAIVSIFGKFAENKYIKAILSGMKMCIVGIIMATGAYMIFDNCISIGSMEINIRAIVLTVVLSVVYFGSRLIMKKGISPILLIFISACCGVVAYNLT